MMLPRRILPLCSAHQQVRRDRWFIFFFPDSPQDGLATAALLDLNMHVMLPGRERIAKQYDS